MTEKNIIVVYGGSFNPPLNSHFVITEQVLNQYEEVDKIVFIPVNKKYPKDGLLDNEHRYNMLKLVVDKNEDFILSDMDMQYQERSLYTYETLEKTKKQFPGKEIWFLIGSDNLKEIHTWKKPEELLSKYKLLVMERNNDNIKDIINSSELLLSHKENILELHTEIKNNYSSSYVRNLIKQKKSARYLMPDEVYEYIKNNKLYME